MRVSTLKFLAAAAALTTFGMALVNGSASDTTLNDIAAYRQWTRINHKPIPVENLSAGG